MRNYIPMIERREDYEPHEFFTCGHGCNNTTFTTLPRSTERMTELLFCPRCGVGILFSSIDPPKKIGYPRSKREWGEATAIFATTKLPKKKNPKQKTMKFREPLLPQKNAPL